MTSKHTPGKWVHVAVEGGWDGVAEAENRDSLICVLKHNNPANARLIAAAPDLLEALNETDVDLTVLLSNIADAQKRDAQWDGMYEVVLRWKARNRAAINKAIS